MTVQGRDRAHAATSGVPGAARGRACRVAALVAAGVVAFFGIVLLAYELAVARVPQHRAALERLVRAQTGLDIRFDELGLRWGWYGPEAVFRRVELGEPRRSAVLLRAPELVVGFDVWQTLRSGQLEAARITLVAADIDLSRSAARAGSAAAACARLERRASTARARRAMAVYAGLGAVEMRLTARPRRMECDCSKAGRAAELISKAARCGWPILAAPRIRWCLQIRRASLRRASLTLRLETLRPPSGVATASSFCPSGWDARHAWCCVSTVTWSDPQG